MTIKPKPRRISSRPMSRTINQAAKVISLGGVTARLGIGLVEARWPVRVGAASQGPCRFNLHRAIFLYPKDRDLKPVQDGLNFLYDSSVSFSSGKCYAEACVD